MFVLSSSYKSPLALGGGQQTIAGTTPTFYVGDVDVELAEFLTGPLHALIDRLHDLPGVLLHPPD